MKNILFSKDIYNYFKEMDYHIVNPFPIVNNKDTVFYSAGIQPLLNSYLNDELEDKKNLFIAQPVIRTQYLDVLSEGTSLAFINSTTAKFNLSENEYLKLIKDWLDFFYQLGLEKRNLTSCCDFYEDKWNNINLSGNRTFYYYNNIEIGDTTFFTRIDNEKIDSMCDLGFGIERIRWCINGNKSYFNLFSDSDKLSSSEKGLISAITLLAICGVKPSQKNSGYRARLFSKKLADLLSSSKLNVEDLKYFKECILYWQDWQKISDAFDFSIIENEYERNCNSNIINMLVNEGYKVAGININIPWNEMQKRLSSSGVPKERIKKIIR